MTLRPGTAAGDSHRASWLLAASTLRRGLLCPPQAIGLRDARPRLTLWDAIETDCRRSATPEVSWGPPTSDWHPRLSTAIASRFSAAGIVICDRGQSPSAVFRNRRAIVCGSPRREPGETQSKPPDKPWKGDMTLRPGDSHRTRWSPAANPPRRGRLCHRPSHCLSRRTPSVDVVGCDRDRLPSLRDSRRILGPPTSDWHPRLSTAIASRFSAAGSVICDPGQSSHALPRLGWDSRATLLRAGDRHRTSWLLARHVEAGSSPPPSHWLSRRTSSVDVVGCDRDRLPSLRDFRRLLGASYLGLASEAINCHRFAIRRGRQRYLRPGTVFARVASSRLGQPSYFAAGPGDSEAEDAFGGPLATRAA